MYKRYTPKPGDIRMKLRKGGGHVDFVYEWKDNKGILIGGNVSDQVKGRPVTLQSLIADRTTYFVDIEGYYGY